MLKAKVAVYATAAAMALSLAAAPSVSQAALISMEAGFVGVGTIERASDQIGTLEDLGNGTYRWWGEWAPEGLDWELEWDIAFSPNPELTFNNILVTNTSGTTQTFTSTVTMPTTQTFAAPTEMTGTLSGSLINGSGASATLSAVPGSSVYTAFIDGNPVQTLLDDPFSVTTSSSDTFGPADFVDEPGPALNTSIGITLEFNLTPGDSASALSSFKVIPEPASLALLGAGGLLLLRRRRG